ncbi:HNH endonuclease [Streptomyces malaysiensis subsp. malaysiensis]|uniref:HNH endonuclease n=1 Tax=Streptomyces malaysiensis TaxID=92644 RepID=A0ABX6W6S0_STRMQ|nr:MULTISPECIES: HNH endonuclease [Streptomyces]QPI56345.1 HNH endonuclease [Streptomyces solisilvae]UHH17832.1 HNH endonuclease [Streptomyces sp. HNM0561]
MSASVEHFTPTDLLNDWADHDLWSCFFCGGSLTDGYHVEHFYPISKGGPHALFNLAPSCATCNLSKGARDPWAFLTEALEARGVDLDECLTVLDSE